MAHKQLPKEHFLALFITALSIFLYVKIVFDITPPPLAYVLFALPFLGFAIYIYRDLIMKYKVQIGIAVIVLIVYNYNSKPCEISAGQGFHMGETIAIKFNSNGRFNYSDKLMNEPKSFWGTWKQVGDQIITTNDRSSTGMGIGQQNTYTYDCDKLTISGFTLVKD